MIESSLEDLVSLAQDSAFLGKSWYFNILSPNCRFNRISDRYGLIAHG